MQIRLLIAVCFVFFWSEEVVALTPNEVKRGSFPFMAILYYSDDAIVDSTGARFVRAAVLIKPEWLVSSSIDHTVMDGHALGFPAKTLLARAGALTLDGNFTLNEDEEEQEREIIQISRPSQHTVEHWYITDITVLKTLVPFKITAAVAPVILKPKHVFSEKNCAILVYAKKFGNSTKEKNLLQLFVELLPPSTDTCGYQFHNGTMTCSLDNEETKNYEQDPEFCVGNSGGPLICENEIMGLQTYIENNCKHPHLYTLIAPWNDMIECAISQQCNIKDIQCNNCITTFKDNLDAQLVTVSIISSSVSPQITTIEEETFRNMTSSSAEPVPKEEEELNELETTKNASTSQNSSTFSIPDPTNDSSLLALMNFNSTTSNAMKMSGNDSETILRKSKIEPQVEFSGQASTITPYASIAARSVCLIRTLLALTIFACMI